MPSAPRPSRRAQALVVVDFQNDFCSARGEGAHRRRDLSRLNRTTENIRRALESARNEGMEVLFVQFLGDRARQRPNMIDRDRKQAKSPKCLEGSWGADFFRISPRPGEMVVRKNACFDAFFNPALEPRLRRKGVRRLILAGVYLDICVDATARTAFQKGFYLSILKDCTESLHYPKTAVLRYMAKYYGADIVTSRDFLRP
ncbi:MAG: cysteine hydrolase [Elusimicrobia bacterium]|nr:cysteine hydrolase [Elusimicrobiota bacterium]